MAGPTTAWGWISYAAAATAAVSLTARLVGQRLKTRGSEKMPPSLPTTDESPDGGKNDVGANGETTGTALAGEPHLGNTAVRGGESGDKSEAPADAISAPASAEPADEMSSARSGEDPNGANGRSEPPDREPRNLRYWATVVGGVLLVGIGTAFTVLAEKRLTSYQQGLWILVFAVVAILTVVSATSHDGVIRTGVDNIKRSVSDMSRTVAFVNGRVLDVRKKADELAEAVNAANNQIRESQQALEKVIIRMKEAETGIVARAHQARLVDLFRTLLLPGVQQIPPFYRFTVWGTPIRKKAGESDKGTGGPDGQDQSDQQMVPLFLPVSDVTTARLRPDFEVVRKAWARRASDGEDFSPNGEIMRAAAAVVIYGPTGATGGRTSLGVLSAMAFDNDGTFEGATGMRKLHRVAASLRPYLLEAREWLHPEMVALANPSSSPQAISVDY